MKIDRIKSTEISAGFVVLCLDDDKNAVLATHEVFSSLEEAEKHFTSINEDRRPIIFELRKKH